MSTYRERVRVLTARIGERCTDLADGVRSAMGGPANRVNENIGHFGMWVNDNIVGNPITFVVAILSVLVVYAAIPLVGGYASWNTGLGLFFNTLSSSFELITGIGAVVGVVVLHRQHKSHRAEMAQRHADLLDMHETHAREVAALHEKVDKALAQRITITGPVTSANDAAYGVKPAKTTRKRATA